MSILLLLLLPFYEILQLPEASSCLMSLNTHKEQRLGYVAKRKFFAHFLQLTFNLCLVVSSSIFVQSYFVQPGGQKILILCKIS